MKKLGLRGVKGTFPGPMRILGRTSTNAHMLSSTKLLLVQKESEDKANTPIPPTFPPPPPTPRIIMSSVQQSSSTVLAFRFPFQITLTSNYI